QAAVVAEAEQAVVAPAVRAEVRVVEGKIIPGVAARGIVLANGPPLALAEVRAPAAPFRSFACFFEAELLRGSKLGHQFTGTRQRPLVHGIPLQQSLETVHVWPYDAQGPAASAGVPPSLEPPSPGLPPSPGGVPASGDSHVPLVLPFW